MAFTGASPHGKSTRLKEAWQRVNQIIPPLVAASHKGEAGRIGILGGSALYTGAPYYAAISALKGGGDLAFIFCEESAAPAIKSYSPEAIVIPVMEKKPSLDHKKDDPDAISDEAAAIQARIAPYIQKDNPRIHALVVGPGLGDDPAALEAAALVIKMARVAEIPLVIDADGIRVVANQPDIISGYNKAVITPNAAEFTRLCEALTVPDDLQALCWSLNNVTVLQKGKADRASDGTVVITCDEPGSYRRCGGQGDVTAGLLGLFMYWAHKEGITEGAFSPNLVAAVAASTITRRAANVAFREAGRSMTTPDVIDRIGFVMEEFFPTSGIDPASPRSAKKGSAPPSPVPLDA